MIIGRRLLRFVGGASNKFYEVTIERQGPAAAYTVRRRWGRWTQRNGGGSNRSHDYQTLRRAVSEANTWIIQKIDKGYRVDNHDVPMERQHDGEFRTRDLREREAEEWGFDAATSTSEIVGVDDRPRRVVRKKAAPSKRPRKKVAKKRARKLASFQEKKRRRAIELD